MATKKRTKPKTNNKKKLDISNAKEARAAKRITKGKVDLNLEPASDDPDDPETHLAVSRSWRVGGNMFHFGFNGMFPDEDLAREVAETLTEAAASIEESLLETMDVDDEDEPEQTPTKIVKGR